MLTEDPADGFTQFSGAVPVDDAQPALVAEERGIEKLLQPIDRFVHGRADEDDLRRGHGFLWSRAPFFADHAASARAGGRPAQRTKRHAHALAANLNLDRLSRGVADDAFRPERRHEHALTRG